MHVVVKWKVANTVTSLILFRIVFILKFCPSYNYSLMVFTWWKQVISYACQILAWKWHLSVAKFCHLNRPTCGKNPCAKLWKISLRPVRVYTPQIIAYPWTVSEVGEIEHFFWSKWFSSTAFCFLVDVCFLLHSWNWQCCILILALWTAEIYGDLDSRGNCVSPPGACWSLLNFLYPVDWTHDNNCCWLDV